MNTPFASIEALRGAFAKGLAQLLEHDGLGPLILVAANAGFDPELTPRLRPALAARYGELLADYRGALAEGRIPAGPQDDQLVFLKLATLGLEELAPTERRRAGPWEVQFNQLRAFRPQRASGRAVSGISAPFDEAGFHFDRPFLAKECFWSGALAGREVALLYNKFPFADLHGLLVPEPAAHRPQRLEGADHEWLWALTAELGATLPGIGLAYNAYGAFASVNHLHLHQFVRHEPLPVAEPRWHHNGGDAPYPLAVHAFDEAGAAWQFIESLHERTQPYNLIYQPGRLYCLPRRPQGSRPLPAWSGGMAWHELAGGLVATSREAYLTLGAATIEEELGQWRPEKSSRNAAA